MAEAMAPHHWRASPSDITRQAPAIGTSMWGRSRFSAGSVWTSRRTLGSIMISRPCTVVSSSTDGSCKEAGTQKR